MSLPFRGRSIPLSVPRKLVCDLIHFANRIPTVPVQRVMDLHALASVRDAGTPRVGWTAIFTKAFGIVSKEFPEFRRAYLEYPRPRLYEHPVPVASVAVERDYRGEPGVFFAYLVEPESMALAEVDATIRRYKTAPVDEVFGFTIGFCRYPRFVRRLAWWWILNVRGSRKAEFLGTFGVSSYAGLGAESLHPLSPLTATVNYGAVGPDGRTPVRVIYDHRVMDGATVARALARMEQVLTEDLVRELKSSRNGAFLGLPLESSRRG